MHEPSIFENIVSNEDGLTELICNLTQFKMFRDFLGRLLAEKLSWPDFILTDESIKSHLSLDGGSVPDITIETEDTMVLVEVKVELGCTLTSNQPDGYFSNLVELRTVGRKALVFLIPDDYVHREELESRLKKHTKRKGHDAVGYAIITWQEFLWALEDSGLTEIDNLFKHTGLLLADWFSIDAIAFTKEELDMLYNSELPATYLKLTGLVEEVRGKLGTSFKTAREINEYGHGFYIKSSRGKDILWFGTWYEFWQQHHAPLVLCVWPQFGPKIVKRFQERFKNDYTVFDLGEEDWSVHPLSLELLGDGKVSDRLVELLTSTARHLIH